MGNFLNHIPLNAFTHFAQLSWDYENESKYAKVIGRYASNKVNLRWYSVFSKLGVNEGIHAWTIRLNSIGRKADHSLYIGIATSTKYKDELFCDRLHEPADIYYSYAFGKYGGNTNGHSYEPRSPGWFEGKYTDGDFEWNEGVVLCIKLDLLKGEMIYKLNGKLVFKIENIHNDFSDSPHVKYRLTVCNYENAGETTIELSSYEKLL